MSVKNIGKMWLATCEDIDDVLLREKVCQTFEPTMERFEAHGIFANLYARYVMIVNRLGLIYDQTLQVQKRACVRRILESATQRMLELQKELKEIELSEFFYLDGTLVEEKWRPEQVQLLCPFYYPMIRPQQMQDIINGIRKPPPPKEEEEEGEKKTPLQLLLEEKARLEEIEANRIDNPWDAAVKLIKIHEKARQKRRLFNFIKMHPEEYTPKQPPILNLKVYSFYHKPDQHMLIPVNRTNYESNFYKTLRSFSQVQFYVNPHRIEQLAGQLAPIEDEPDVIEIIDLVDVPDEVIVLDATINDVVEPPPPPDIPDVVVVDTVQMEEQTIVDTERNSEKSVNIEGMQEGTDEIDETVRRNEAATKIQRCFLLFQIKRMVRRTRLQHYVRIGMADERKWDYSKRDEIERKLASNKLKKAAFDEAFVKACQDTKARIVQIRSPWIMEDISDQTRFWFREMYDIGGEMDVFPPVAKGGTVLVITGMTPSPWEFLEALQKKAALKAMSPEKRKKILDDEKKKKLEAKKLIKEAKKKKKAAKKAKLALAAKQGKTWEFTDEEFITKNYLDVETGMKDYHGAFRFIDEFANVKSKPYMEWVEEDIYAELHVELRGVVDELMRVEYELLRMAHAVDIKKKYKPPKAPKAPKKGKKGKKGKKNKPERPIEFGDRDIEDVYDSFLEAGVIATVPPTRLDDYVGDRNYGAYDMRNYLNADPMHYMGEVRDVLRNYIHGMGDLTLKHPKSLCIIGPPGCGKKFMINSLATEMGLIKFDLSPSIVVKFKDTIQEFMSDVLKMAKLMQPSMLYIDGAHNPFIKKIVPEDAGNEPRLIAKYLPKMMKGIKPIDRIMLMSSTNQPWNCAVAKLKKTFEVILLSGGTDYNSTLLLWRSALLNMYGTDRMTDFSALTKVTTYYGAQQMIDTVHTVVDLKRRVYLERRPLDHIDLLNELLNCPAPYTFPLTPADLDKYRKVFVKVNKLAKKRAKFMKAQESAKKKKK